MNANEPNFFRDQAVIADPRSYFDLMRERCPVSREAYEGTLMVTGYAAALEVLNDKEGVFSNAVSVVGPIPPLPFEPQGSDITGQLEEHRAELPWSDHLVCMDGARHAEHRAIVGSLLTFKRLRQNEDYLHGLADRMLDAIVGKGVRNIVPEYAHATTVYAISDLLGIPLEDRAELLELIGAPPSQIEGDAVHKIGSDPLVFLKERFDGYLRDRIDNPRGDLMSELVAARFKDGSQPRFEDLSGLARFMFGAGQDTTSRLIAMGVQHLGEDKALQAHMRADAKAIPAFVEELLRHDAPVKAVYRLARRDTRIGDIEVPAGTIVTVCLSGANNDPEHFAQPHDFRPDRPHVRDHMAFSRGAHACLGAPLGRMEARIAIERLLARTSDIVISEAHHGSPENRVYRYEPTFSFRNLADLHAELVPA
ncbi:cytochrome [Novosphingobium sp. PC22D]|uniref:cytochrome P450 n=1 Tax=Novosphingobium sp. PC22D TaxID=1962403 RepID=UPI000BF06DBC|nr:cytochrome P450 [Novosphingobium sp. PC22D]PEQ11554.1 cytochrome [Novosphingobium sp. PC22D]